MQLFVPKELAEKFHLDTLQQQKESYLDKNLQQYYSDVVYTVGYGKNSVTVALLLEHKSYVPLSSLVAAIAIHGQRLHRPGSED